MLDNADPPGAPGSSALPGRHRNLVHRVLTGLVLIVLLLGACVVGPIAFSVLVGIFGGMAIYEWLTMSRGHTRFMIVGTAYIIIGLVSFLFIYIGIHNNIADIQSVLIIVCTNDIAAYVVGRLIGGPRLAPRISPNKTWAGAIGGLVIATGLYVSLLGWDAGYGGYRNPLDGTVAWRYLSGVVVFAAFVAIAGQAGDLLESAAKRRFGVKDSGWILPGHGGILDRIDGLLLASPMAIGLGFLLTKIIFPGHS